MTKTKKKKKYRWLIWVLAVLVIGVFALALLNKKNSDKGKEVTTTEVIKTTIYETVGASGKIYPITEVKISSDVSGEIVELYVAEGDSVSTGQLLAKIDPDAFESQVDRARASVNNARANASMSEASLQTSVAQKEQVQASLINARKIHERNTTLFNEGVVSQAEFDASLAALQAQEANLKSAEAGIASGRKSIEAAGFNIKSAEAGLKELQTALRRTTITAPMNGVVSNLSVELGERVVGTIQMSGTELMRIANLYAMEVQVDVSENDILRVAMSDSVLIEVDAYYDKEFYGRVTQIANSASNAGQQALATDQVTNFIVTVQINPDSYKSLIVEGRKFPFRPGMSATVEIFTEQKSDIIAVPIQAVSTRDKNDKKSSSPESSETDLGETAKDLDDVNEVVFAVRADTADMVIVKTGIQNDEFIEIISGLDEGETIVKGPYSAVSRTLDAGDKLAPKSENDKKKSKEKED